MSLMKAQTFKKCSENNFSLFLSHSLWLANSCYSYRTIFSPIATKLQLRQLNVEPESPEMRGKSTKKANYCHYMDSCCAMVNYGDNSGGTMSMAESNIWLQKCGFYIKFLQL